jgi:hypothetical protein
VEIDFAQQAWPGFLLSLPSARRALLDELRECTGLEFDGCNAEGQWERLSVWQPVGAPTPGGGRARTKESDAGLLVAHLTDCLHYTPERIIRVLELANMRRRTERRVLLSNGRKRLKEKYLGVCPFHPPAGTLALALKAESDNYKKSPR